MESKVKILLLARSEMFFHAYRRQAYIDVNDFHYAMYHHFKFLDLAEQFGAVKNSMTNKENQDYIQAMLCWDYK